MASYSSTHPFAYHVFPLTAARSIWRLGALHGKDDLGAAGPIRRTTGELDRRLGFAGAKIVAFSRADLASLQLLGPPPEGAVLEPGMFPGYDSDGDPLGPQRRVLDDFLAGRSDAAPGIDFDAIRHRA